MASKMEIMMSLHLFVALVCFISESLTPSIEVKIYNENMKKDKEKR